MTLAKRRMSNGTRGRTPWRSITNRRNRNSSGTLTLSAAHFSYKTQRLPEPLNIGNGRKVHASVAVPTNVVIGLLASVCFAG
ncbi:hypothetical protein [Roseobacter weihaiensis]|uniref:hypothetical protein n=1 Tax=Roseobacter weihaiensis TaxID=2763262 RepID=UPI001D0AC4DB|nr:hypothetical protein [Roseobacter sp. H9]